MIRSNICFYFFNAKSTQVFLLPNWPVLKDLRSKPLLIADEAQIKFDEALVTMKDINMCLTYGDVDFSRSNVEEQNGKLYIIEGQNTQKEPITLEMIRYSERVMIKDVYLTEK